MALRARRLRHLERQHRVVPEVRLLPPQLLLPLFFLLLSGRRVSRVAEADRLPHPFVAYRATDSVDWVRRAAAEVSIQIGVRRKGLRIFLEAFLVDAQMAGLASVHLRDSNEVHVVHDVRQDELLDLDRRGHEVEQRRIAEVVFRDAWRIRVEQLLDPRLLGMHVLDLLARRRDLACVLPQILLRREPLRRQRLHLQVQVA